ncbi:hypothetical protein TBLA_0D03420 [Henningerozyma blattae CBS 6284]|uniref:Uncharacterized protein n=1 Tax=Henningerozyma blattae (strain ATCC 34711 / CBS 6284 / DSM 70876 / NBRC 10599 / NRRL Y-10934 / UCD 77-7) TaxID=1071380 RepID=I2H390_HENB6|nr:hypothetical protein TBLA_0D03420 [Tetrapisispora blattae CBS 6284]CCH60842.1 hypothetical protein TBLA_0D03420 [Tetrapisispora blattae CBS 6284]
MGLSTSPSDPYLGRADFQNEHMNPFSNFQEFIPPEATTPVTRENFLSNTDQFYNDNLFQEQTIQQQGLQGLFNTSFTNTNSSNNQTQTTVQPQINGTNRISNPYIDIAPNQNLRQYNTSQLANRNADPIVGPLHDLILPQQRPDGTVVYYPIINRRILPGYILEEQMINSNISQIQVPTDLTIQDQILQEKWDNGQIINYPIINGQILGGQEYPVLDDSEVANQNQSSNMNANIQNAQQPLHRSNLQRDQNYSQNIQHSREDSDTPSRRVRPRVNQSDSQPIPNIQENFSEDPRLHEEKFIAFIDKQQEIINQNRLIENPTVEMQKQFFRSIFGFRVKPKLLRDLQDPLQVKVYEVDNYVTQIRGQKVNSFYLDDTIVERFLPPFLKRVKNVNNIYMKPSLRIPIIHYLKAASYIQMFVQIFSTLSEDQKSSESIVDLSNLSLKASLLPAELSSIISGLGCFETEYSIFELKWPFTTLKTALVNATYCLYMSRESAKYQFPKDQMQKPKFPMHYPVHDLIWNDLEGYRKSQYFFERYLKEESEKNIIKPNNHGPNMKYFKLFSPNRQLSFHEVAKSIPKWYKNRYDYLKVFKIYLLNQLEFEEKFVTDDPELIKALSVVNLTKCNFSNEILKNTVLCTYDDCYQKFLDTLNKNFDMIFSKGTGFGWSGQIYRRFENGNIMTPIITPCIDQIYGNTFFPSKIIDMDFINVSNFTIAPEIYFEKVTNFLK